MFVFLELDPPAFYRPLNSFSDCYSNKIYNITIIEYIANTDVFPEETFCILETCHQVSPPILFSMISGLFLGIPVTLSGIVYITTLKSFAAPSLISCSILAIAAGMSCFLGTVIAPYPRNMTCQQLL